MEIARLIISSVFFILLVWLFIYPEKVSKNMVRIFLALMALSDLKEIIDFFTK